MTVPDALREFALEPADNARLANLCGPLDENLRLLEARLDVEIRRRGDSFRVLGARAVSAEQTLRELFQLAEAEEVTPQRVHLWRCASTSRGGPTEGERADPGIRLPRGGVRARGHHQRQYLSNIHSHDLT
ncbi:PhoH family protein, partial [mine drainage metagenome]